MVRTLFLLGLAVLYGCSDPEDTREPLSTAEQEAETRQPVEPEHEGPTEVEMVAAMEAHYSSTILAHDALIQGDLDEFRAQLAETDSHELPPNSPEHWKPFDEQLHLASRAGAEAMDRAAAAESMGRVVLACGTCHGGVGAGPIYPAPAPRDGSDPLEEAMREHQWATERLWEGVTGPWDNAWERGAAELAETRVFGEAEAGSAPDESLLGREAALRALGEEARTTKTLGKRAELYGRLLATCGECHEAVGVELPPYK